MRMYKFVESQRQDGTKFLRKEYTLLGQCSPYLVMISFCLVADTILSLT